MHGKQAEYNVPYIGLKYLTATRKRIFQPSPNFLVKPGTNSARELRNCKGRGPVLCRD